MSFEFGDRFGEFTGGLEIGFFWSKGELGKYSSWLGGLGCVIR